MRYDIIAIGDELLIGQVTDTNSGNIARMLEPHGWALNETRVIGDDAAAITAALDAALAQVEVVLMTGGLGPTKDDITKPALARYFGGEMVRDATVEADVRRVFAARGLELNESTLSQAWVPSSCRVIHNRVGTAPLMWFERGGKVVVSMPGVPHEMLTMLREAVLPQLLERFPDDQSIDHRTTVVTGIIESALSERLAAYEASLPPFVKLAYLPEPGIIRLRLSGRHSDAALLRHTMDTLDDSLQRELGGYAVCHEDKPLPAIVGDRLRAAGLTMSTAESCTGGNIAHRMTLIAGSSDYFVGGVVAYANEVKRDVLGVSADDLSAHGAVSEPVVRQMALGACRATGSACAVATSGIAGPGGGTPSKPVGTVWIAAAIRGNVVTRLLHLPGDRRRVIDRATTEALLLLLANLQ